jgi:hypothetical protein
MLLSSVDLVILCNVPEDRAAKEIEDSENMRGSANSL